MRERAIATLIPTVIAAVLSGCATTAENNTLLGASVLALGHTPTTNIGQIYYLGVFDPREQLPPTLYRIRVQGQASALSSTNFASGWVHADLVDSLSGRVELKNNTGNGEIPKTNGDPVTLNADKSGLNRRLVMFGPEGFRMAPKDHRLVVVMASNPSSFFSSVDRALGVVAGATQAMQGGPDVPKEIMSDFSRMSEERRITQRLLDSTTKE